MAIFSKILKKTAIGKRLSVPTRNRRCFLNFRGKHQVEFKAKDKNGRVWSFGCSIRTKGRYPKTVLSKGWLQFVRFWKLAVNDEVILHDKDGEGCYRIEVVKHSAQNLEAEDKPRLKSHIQVGEPKFIDFFALESRNRRGKLEQSSLQSPLVVQNLDAGDKPGLKAHMQVREPKLIDFFALESRNRRGKLEQSSFQSPLVVQNLDAGDKPGLKAHMQVREPKFIDFFALESQSPLVDP